jgi:hypothetical protein
MNSNRAATIAIVVLAGILTFLVSRDGAAPLFAGLVASIVALAALLGRPWAIKST